MRVIRPTVITDAVLLGSNVIEVDPDADWAAGTTYATGSEVGVRTGTRIDIYRSIKFGNMLSWSEDFTQSAWLLNTNVTVAGNTTYAPDGAVSADRVSDTSAATYGAAYHNLSVPDDAQVYTTSIYVKKLASAASYHSALAVSIYGGSTNVTPIVYFNAYSGAISSSLPAGSYGIIDAGSGYWRIWLTASNNHSGNANMQVAIYPAYGQSSALGTLDQTVTGSLEVWGAQIEKGAAPTAYTGNTGIANLNTGYAPAASPAWWTKVMTTYAAYDPAVTYAANDIVIRSTTHRAYQSLAGANTGNTPETTPAKWLDIAPTNRWAMFDQSVGTLTTGFGTITVQLAPGLVDALAVLDLDDAESVTVTMTDGGVQVYTRTQATATGGAVIADWYAYFTEEVGTKTALTFFDLPAHANGIITVTVKGNDPNAPVSCGTLLVGRSMDIGRTEAGAKVGITSFSKKDTDEFGVTSVVKRANSKRATLRTMLPTNLTDALERELAKLDAVPCLWEGQEGFESLTIYGFFKDFEVDLALPVWSYCSLTIEGLT